MDGTDAEVLDRIRDQAGAFESQTDMKDAKVNDGNQYKGLLNVQDYKKRRAEAMEDPEVKEQKKRDAVANALAADRSKAAQDARDREAREAQRREKLQRELAAEQPPAEAEGSSTGPKKKKKKKLAEGALSFDADE
uniref:Uncharacterized protein n=1 Tax=Haptolina brevifila TaxID=156173 RepID=A0A7S2BSL0_9EUKA|mmetsp:Transcript_16281/g.32750  ORF Transcript_16281/g.32750 Transcript_16281/m.32750 type:complete len:136 (+) Transcript_16281:117-524(+)